MTEIFWTETASGELQEAVDYLIREAGIDTALDVYHAVEGAVLRLATQPESCPVYAEPVRRLVIGDLPYSCFYEYRDETIVILHIRHDKQLPLDARKESPHEA